MGTAAQRIPIGVVPIEKFSCVDTCGTREYGFTMEWPKFPQSVVAVVVVDSATAGVAVARALSEGGISTVEVTLRTPDALDAIEAIAHSVPEVVVGAGTVLTPEECIAVLERGARFAVAPGINPTVVHQAQEIGLPFAPGVATPSEIEQAHALGCRVLKFFPATGLGGPTYLSAVLAPYRRLELRIMPTGGITVDSMPNWLAIPEVAAVGGTWLTKGLGTSDSDLREITARARQAIRAIEPAVQDGEGSSETIRKSL